MRKHTSDHRGRGILIKEHVAQLADGIRDGGFALSQNGWSAIGFRKGGFIKGARWRDASRSILTQTTASPVGMTKSDGSILVEAAILVRRFVLDLMISLSNTRLTYLGCSQKCFYQ